MNSHDELRLLMRGYFISHGVGQHETPGDRLIDAAAQNASDTQQVTAVRSIIEQLGFDTKIECDAAGEEVMTITPKK